MRACGVAINTTYPSIAPAYPVRGGRNGASETSAKGGRTLR
ncbi:hypothetical protein VDGL01_04674 [Verticillium dahliae]